jgi:hypothetical protein
MHGDTSLARTSRDFSRTPRLVPASTLADGKDIRLSPDAASDQLIRHQSRVDAILRRRPQLGGRVVPFGYGAGI